MLTLDGMVAKEFAGISFGCNRRKRVKPELLKKRLLKKPLKKNLSATQFGSKRDETYLLL